MRQKPAGKKLRDLIPLLPPQLVLRESLCENENTGSIPLIHSNWYRRVIWNILTTFSFNFIMITLSIATATTSTSSERHVDVVIRLYILYLYALLAVLFLSSAFAALCVGGMVSTLLYTSTSFVPKQPQREFLELQQCPEQDNHDVLDASHPKMKTSSTATAVAAVGNMINFEAMVHPSMITHSSPTKVAIVGYDYDPQKADIVSNVLIEVMKHTSVDEVVILRNKEEALRNGQECSSHGPLFDVIIDPTSVEVVSIEYFASLYTCLKDDGVVSWLP